MSHNWLAVLGATDDLSSVVVTGVVNLFGHVLFKENFRNLNVFDVGSFNFVVDRGVALAEAFKAMVALGDSHVSNLRGVSLSAIVLLHVLRSLSIDGLSVVRLLVHVTRLFGVDGSTIVAAMGLLIRIGNIDVSIGIFFSVSLNRSECGQSERESSHSVNLVKLL